MSTMASQINGISIVYSTVSSGADQRRHQNSASLAFVRGIHRWSVNSPHKGPVKPGLYFSRRQSPTVARLGDRRRQSCVCLYFSWRLSPAQVGDSRQQSPTVVFKVQQCWTFNAVASSRWHFPSNQRATTAFIRSRPMQIWRTQVVIKHIKLQICVCHRCPDCKSHRK